jgi:hypothetical protein
MTDSGRRRFLELCGGVGLTAVAGCLRMSGGTSTPTPSTTVRPDSDGDGVVDSEDYAPGDPAVQRKAQLREESTTDPESATPTEPARTETRTADRERRTPFDAPGERVPTDSLASWTDVESATVVNERAYTGETAIRLQDMGQDGIGNRISHPVERSRPSSLAAALLIDTRPWNTVSARWRDDAGDVIHSVRLHHREGVSEKSLYYGGRQVTLRREVRPFTWYFVELRDISWSLGTVGQILVNGSTAASGVAFANAGDAISTVQLRVHGGGEGSIGYIDELLLDYA